MEQHVAPGRDVRGRSVFDLVVADAVFAGDEDHAAGCQPGHVHRVVPGARDDRHVRVAQFLRRPRYCVDAVGVKTDGRIARY